MRILNGIVEREGEIYVFDNDLFATRSIISTELQQAFSQNESGRVVGHGASIHGAAGVIEFVSADYDSAQTTIDKVLRRLGLVAKTEVVWDDPDSSPVDEDEF